MSRAVNNKENKCVFFFIFYRTAEDSQRIKHGMVFKFIASHTVYTVHPLYNVGVGLQWFMTLKWICRCNDFLLFRSRDENTQNKCAMISTWFAMSESLISNLDKLKHVVEQYFWSFSISTCTYFLGIIALKPKSRQNLQKFKLFQRIFHPGSDKGCHWHLHTALWNIWWIINEPCGQFDLWLLALIALFFTSIFFFFFLHLCSKFSSSHSVKILLCQLISRRIIAVRMSTCQSIKVTPVKTSNGALLPLRLITWLLCN